MARASSEHSGTQPYVYLDFTGTSYPDRMTYSWEFYYYASYAVSTSSSKPVHAWIKGSAQSSWTTLKETSYAISGKTGSNLIASGTVSIPRTHSSQTVEGYVRIEFGGVVYSGITLGTRNGSETVTIGAKTSYSVSYNANGGEGAPNSQTKWYDETLTLSSTAPTREGYNFLGWGTSAGATSPMYQPGSAYKGNAALALYAIWEQAITAPRIVSADLYHSDSSKNPSDTGTCLTMAASIVCGANSESQFQQTAYSVYIGSSLVASGTASPDPSTGEATISALLDGAYSADSTYTAKLICSYATASATTQAMAPARFYTLDFKARGKGIGIGQRATLDGLHISMETDHWNALRVNGYDVLTALAIARAYGKGDPSAAAASTPTTGYYKSQVVLDGEYSELDYGFAVNAAGGIVCPYTGRVRIDASVYFSSTASGHLRGCYIHNGSTEIGGSYGYASQPNVSGLEADVTADDVIYLMARGSSSSSEQFYHGNNMTYLRIQYVTGYQGGSDIPDGDNMEYGTEE